MPLLKFLVRLGIGAALVVYLIHEHEVPFEEIADRLLQLPLWALLLALLLNLAGQSLCAFRWSLVAALAGHATSFRVLWPIYFSGMFFNTCLPTSIGGDVLRVVGMARHTGSKSKALASVFMDRNVGMAALLALGLSSALVSGASIQVTLSTYFQEPLVLDLWPLFLLLLLGYILANLVLFSPHWYPRVERQVLRRLPTALHAKIEKLHTALQAYRRSCAHYGTAFLLSLAYQASEALLVWVLARGLGLELPFWVFGALVMFQAVAGLEAHRMCEYPVEAKPLAMELTVERILPDAAGLIRVPEAPGLGMTPNLQVVRQYLVDTEIKIGGKVLQASALACSTESFFLQPRSGQDFWPTAYALPPKASTQF